MRRKRYALIASVVGTLIVIGIVIGFVVATGSEDKKPTAAGGTGTKISTASPSTPAASSSSTAAVAAYPCDWKKSGTAAKRASVPPTTTPPKKGTVDVSVQSSQGAMTFTLNRAAAPCAVESFVSLARQKYFDATSCHRLTGGSLSVLQCGDPSGTGSGGPGYSFQDELTGKEKYTRGVLAMANAGPNTNGSQFFIVYKDSTLGPQYTIFGKVSKGLSVVDKVAAKGSTPANDGKPKLPMTLTKVTVAN
ncbi:MAG: peptidyl-prolyl cis-trans isomerase [Pseudonocardiales bacterium]|nr:peptidyl-prolyl cis-trans isomerase [Pseudonocardiales bacterium]